MRRAKAGRERRRHRSPDASQDHCNATGHQAERQIPLGVLGAFAQEGPPPAPGPRVLVQLQLPAVCSPVSANPGRSHTPRPGQGSATGEEGVERQQGEPAGERDETGNGGKHPSDHESDGESNQAQRESETLPH